MQIQTCEIILFKIFPSFIYRQREDFFSSCQYQVGNNFSTLDFFLKFLLFTRLYHAHNFDIKYEGEFLIAHNVNLSILIKFILKGLGRNFIYNNLHFDT